MAGKQSNAAQKRGVRQWNNANSLEAFKDLGDDFRRGITDDLLKGTASDLFTGVGELFGLKTPQKISGTLGPDETLDLTVLEAKQREEFAFENRRPAPEQNFRPQPENFIFHQTERAVEHEIEALLAEIKKEVKRFDQATRNLESETAKVMVEEVPPNPGVYHINFFEWLLGLLRDLRKKVENAGTWLSMLQSKRTQKRYWNRFKKHGTSFGLSGERVVSTQTG